MTEAAIITIAIVAGIVGLFWVVIHYAYKLQAGKPEPLVDTDVHVYKTAIDFAPVSAEQAAARGIAQVQQQYPFSNN